MEINVKIKEFEKTVNEMAGEMVQLDVNLKEMESNDDVLIKTKKVAQELNILKRFPIRQETPRINKEKNQNQKIQSLNLELQQGKLYLTKSKLIKKKTQINALNVSYVISSLIKMPILRRTLL